MHHPHTRGESCGHDVHEKVRDAASRHGFKMPFGTPMHGHGFGGPGGMRARRGDVRAAVLRLLSEQPMHGYQMIQELASRSDGAWTPSPGSVYPTLQLLADEGLIVAEESAGKKVFSLTDNGVAAVAETADQPAPWEDAAHNDGPHGAYRASVAKLMHAAIQIGKGGSDTQTAEAIEVLNDARKKLYSILAEG